MDYNIHEKSLIVWGNTLPDVELKSCSKKYITTSYYRKKLIKL